MSIHSIVTLPSEPEPPSPQAASSGAAVTAAAPAETAVRNERRDRWGLPMVVSWMGWAAAGADGDPLETFRNSSRLRCRGTLRTRSLSVKALRALLHIRPTLHHTTSAE